MSRKLDIKEVEAALMEAAVAATHGSVEERSGRFIQRESSAISAVEYDEEDSALDITFTGGKTYRYKGVPADVYAGLLDADSKGQYFNSRIKNAFDFSEVVARPGGKRLL
ncbi:MAG TPA: KTSC domain-containing protein [Bradyrhizobium sp.]|jgi:hypothetical protein|nr:KTSC domain-containing protein [Bradyrhizobium sp.]